jgi:hypothetical protein
VHGVAFDSVSVTNQASRTVQLQFRNAYLRYLSAYVGFANENGDLPVANPTKDDTSRAKFLAWINSNYTVLGIPLFGDTIPLSSVQFDVPADASIAKVYFGSLGVGGQAFCPESLDGTILTLILNIGIPTISAGGWRGGDQCTAPIAGGGHRLRGPTGLLAVHPRNSHSDVANGIFGTANSGSAVGVLTSLGSAILSAFFASGDAAIVAVELGVRHRHRPASRFHGSSRHHLPRHRGTRRRGDDRPDRRRGAGEPGALHQPALPDADHHGHHQPRYERLPVPRDGPQVRGHPHYDTASTVAHKQCGTIEPGRTADIVAVFDNVPSGGMVTVDVYLTSESAASSDAASARTGRPPVRTGRARNPGLASA